MPRNTDDPDDSLPVVVGVDSSRCACQAALWAASEAAARSAELHVVHAYFDPSAKTNAHTDRRDDQVENSARQLLRAVAHACRTAAPDVVVRTHPVADSAVAALVKQSHDAQLLVVGGRGSGRFTGLMVGSVSAAVAAQARCPVVVVRGTARPQPHGPIVVGLTTSADDDAAIRFAFETAIRWNCGLNALHGWRTSLEDDFLVAFLDADASFDVHVSEVQDRLERRLAAWRENHPKVAVSAQVVHDTPASALIEEARRTEARLIVLGARQGDVSRSSLGATSHSVLHHAPCPVAVVRT